jgi:hypothetical protein
MRINDIISESNTEEGIGSAIGSIAGGLAKGAGAVVGGIRGAGDAFGKGYTAGRSAVSGDSKQAINQAKAQKLRAQADQLDGGSSAQSYGNSNSAQPTNTSQANTQNAVATPNNNAGSAVNNPAVNSAQPTNTSQANTQNAVATPNAEVSNPLDNKKFLSSLQHLKGDDVERVRSMLQKKVAMGESVELDEFDIKGMANTAKKGIGNFVKGAKFGYNDPTRATNLSKNPNTGTMTKAGRVAGKLGTQAVQGIKAGAGKAADIAKATPGAIAKVAKATPGALATAAGSVAATGTQMKHDYQMARGGSMTPQDLHQMIASFDADEAKKVLGFFNTIHDSGEPAQAEPVDQTQATGTDGKPNLKLHKGGLGESRVGYHSRFLGTEI